MIIDAENAIVGRLATYAAKSALQGEDVIIINGEKAVISGDPLKTREKYYKRRGMTNKADPELASKWPRRADLLFKRIIKGMLPKHTKRGREAESKIMVYMGVPKEYEGKAEKFKYLAKDLGNKYIALKELTERI
jgi:large subunit ribosomal protein L13